MIIIIILLLVLLLLLLPLTNVIVIIIINNDVTKIKIIKNKIKSDCTLNKKNKGSYIYLSLNFLFSEGLRVKVILDNRKYIGNILLTVISSLQKLI